MNIITNTDSYKLSHYKMLPPGCTKIGSYCEARGGEYDKVLFFGLQPILKQLAGKILTKKKIDEAEKLARWHFPNQNFFNRAGWTKMLKAHGGRLPILINAVPEGSLVNTGNVLFTIENTDDDFPWLTNHVESMLLHVWYPTTVATISYEMKQLIEKALRTSGNLINTPFMLHDFGFRGSTSSESAQVGGAAHLVNFAGTDNLPALEYANDHYGAKLHGFSVPAAEHSTIVSWGKARESESYKNMLKSFGSILSIVCDSYDAANACDEIFGQELKSLIKTRDGMLVVRPDSGNPLKSMKSCLSILGKRFGYEVNDQGFKLLPPYLRLLQGDGISRHTIGKIITGLLKAGWSLDNVKFGSGGGLLQDCSRDTLGFAIKCSWAEIDGKIIAVRKETNGKTSKAGKLRLVKSGSNYETINDINDPRPDLLQTVFCDGEIVKYNNWHDITKSDE